MLHRGHMLLMLHHFEVVLVSLAAYVLRRVQNLLLLGPTRTLLDVQRVSIGSLLDGGLRGGHRVGLLGLVDRRLVAHHLLLDFEHIARLRGLRHGHIVVHLHLRLTLSFLRILVDLQTTRSLGRLLLLPIRALSEVLEQLLDVGGIIHFDVLNLLLLILNDAILRHALSLAMDLPPSCLG